MIRSYSSLLFWLGMTIGSSLMLYHTSDRVHALNQQLSALYGDIENEQRALHVLKAEWAYLANPARIEKEAKKHLRLDITAPLRIAGLPNIDGLLPLESGIVPPVRLAKAELAVKKIAPPPEKAERPRTKQDRILASLNAGRLNDHVTIQRAVASAETGLVKNAPDRIGLLIGTLGLHP